MIDSGVGPHADIAVAGGGCFVTGEDPADFLDNGIGHGTHVAGIIAGKMAGGSGIYGVAPACRLLAYRVCPKTGERGRARSSDIASALERAIADGCDIVNISMGSLEPMPEMPDILEKARNAGIAVFAATGNDGQSLLRYPARYSHTLAVGALGRDGTFPADCPESFQESEIRRKKEFVAEFSNYGLSTDFIGPGVAVLSTFPGGRYAMMSGTSMATPFTSGMAARLLSGNPNLLNMPRGPEKADAIVKMLSQAARKVGWSAEYEGFGVLK
ncbi:S8 family serine peptidase [Variovorax sp. S2]|uniref:S8 family serine peptidase n=1 Tax=Variovorax sp. S12S4 TaxID=3029170 RepID=UPI00215C6BFD|nr:S8 family serine peptidase [Variovorax sp. S12S4]